MFGKLLLIILAAALVASALLVIRHRRLETAHRLGVIYGEMLEHERSLWSLQAEVARRTRPEDLRRRLPGDWAAMPDPERTTIDLEAMGRPNVGLTLAPEAAAIPAIGETDGRGG